MDFTTMIKESLKEEYSLMLDGKTKNQDVDISVQSSAEFLNKCKALTEQTKPLIKPHVKQEEGLNKLSQQQAISSQPKQTKKTIIVNIFATLAYISPIILSIIFAVVLFSNSSQISILYSFGWWCFAWVVFTILSLLTTCTLFYKRREDWDALSAQNIGAAVAVAVIMFVCSVVVFPMAGQLSSDFDPTTFITLKAVGKTTSTSGGYLASEINFHLKNVGPVKVNYVKGDMQFYNGSTPINKITFYIDGNYEAGQEYNITLKLDNDDSNPVHRTSYENLGITYKITSMRFKDSFKDYSLQGDTFVVKELSDGDETENNYQEAIEKYNQGLYEEAQSLFEMLGAYKDSASYIDLCEQKIWEGKVESSLHSVAGGSAVLPDNYDCLSYRANDFLFYDGNYYDAFSCSLGVSSDQAETYLNDFKNKLELNGFVQIETNVYQKMYTVIKFTELKEGYQSFYFNYYAWYMSE